MSLICQNSVYWNSPITNSVSASGCLNDRTAYLFDVDVFLGTRLKQVDAHLVGKLLRVLRQNNFVLRVVIFIANYR